MLSERGFNIHIFPIIQYRGRKFESEYIRKDKHGKLIFIATKESRWNLRCYKFMDWLSTKVRQQFDDYMINLNPNLGLVTNIKDPRLSPYCLLIKPENMYYVLKGSKTFNGPYWKMFQPYNTNIRVNCKEVAKDLKWEKKHVKKIIKMISNYKFKTNYKIKSVDVNYRKSPHFHEGYNNLEYKNFESIFNASFGTTNKYTEYEGMDRTDDDIDIWFNTGFGICFIHNIYTGGYQLIDENLYNLSESTQIIYRERFFTYDKLPHVYLNDEWIFNKLGITTKNTTVKKNIIKKIINELSTIEKINFERICNNKSYEFSIGMKKQNKIIQLNKLKI